jgi:hypothetical protein
MFDVHPNERVANINAGVGFYKLYHLWVLEMSVGISRHRPTRFSNWNDGN